MIIFYKGKKISIPAKKTNFITKGTGLTFKTRNTPNLLFEFGKDVTWQGNLTSLFVFFPFLALWLDSKNRVIDHKVINPFLLTIKQKKRFRRILELPINEGNKGLIVRFIGKKNYEMHFRR